MKSEGITEAAKLYAKDVYGDATAAKRSWPVKVTIDDFVAGAEWMDRQPETVAQRTAANLELVSAFCDHIKETDGIEIPEPTMVSFFEKD